MARAFSTWEILVINSISQVRRHFRLDFCAQAGNKLDHQRLLWIRSIVVQKYRHFWRILLFMLDLGCKFFGIAIHIFTINVTLSPSSWCLRKFTFSLIFWHCWCCCPVNFYLTNVCSELVVAYWVHWFSNFHNNLFPGTLRVAPSTHCLSSILSFWWLEWSKYG